MTESHTQRPPRSRQLRSSWLALCWCGLACLLGSMTLVGCTPSLPGVSPNPTSSASSQLSPAWAAVLNQIGPNDEVSLQTALQAYTLVFGPLPGVQTSPSDNGLIGSGTLAAYMILRHFHDLTAAQQQSVLQRLGIAPAASAAALLPLAARVSPGPPASAATLAPLAARVSPAPPVPPVTQAPSAQLGGGTLVAGARAMMAPTPVPTDAPGTATYRAMLNAFIPKYNGLLAYTYTLPIALAFDPSLKQTVEGQAVPVDAQGQLIGAPVLCAIHLNLAINSFTLEQQQFALAHELFHCYQAAIIGSVATVYAAPDWLIEGSAEWAGAMVSGATSTEPQLHNMWGFWLANPDHPLFQRSYDAVGFFSLLNQAGISPWKVLPAMLLSQTKGTIPDNVAAYQTGTKPAAQKVQDQWASSFERDISLGADWDLDGPGILTPIMYGGPVIHDVTLGNGQSTPVTTPAYTALDDDVTSQADIVHVSITGTARLHDGASFERVTSADGNYCTKQGGCACPPGSANQGIALPQLTGVLHLAVTGGEQGANGVLSGLTLQQFCTKQKPTAVPSITAAFCQSFMTLAQANAIMQPPTPATSIRVDNGPAGGSCNYEYAKFKSVVSVLFLPYAGPQTPQAEQQGLEVAASKISVNGGTVTTTMVGGVGDAALFVTGTLASPPLKQAYLDVIYGAVVLSCFNPNVGSASFASQRTALTQVCQRVVNVLDP